MDLLRRNLFYVVLGAVLLVALIVALIVRSGPVGYVDKQLNDRKAMLADLRRINREPAVNEDVLTAKDSRLTSIRQAQAKVTQDSIDRNRRNYQVMSFPISNQPAQPLFPLKKELLDKYGAYDVTKQYHEDLLNLRKKLQPIVPPTPAEIDAAVKAITERNRTNSPTSAPAGGRGSPAEGARDSASAELLRQQAIVEVGLARAAAGLIYLPETALDMVFPVSVPSAKVETLWMAQVNLWVQSDILAAISETNEQARRSAGGLIKPSNVAYSAVKQLVQIKVDSKYVQGGGAPAAGGGGAPAGAKAEVALVSLTGRGCTKDYDVIHYTFTVIMPTRYLGMLERNLMARNYHTVLNISMAAEAKEGSNYFGSDPVTSVTIEGELLFLSAWTRGTAARSEGEPLKGPDGKPIVATDRFGNPALGGDGKPLLAREKGALLKDKNGSLAWVMPPLMPVLQDHKLPITDPAALREEDQARLQETP